jgi:hypothetical protein
MTTEMVLVPKKRYEKMVEDDKGYNARLKRYETLLNNNGIDLNDTVSKDSKSNEGVIESDAKELNSDVMRPNDKYSNVKQITENTVVPKAIFSSNDNVVVAKNPLLKSNVSTPTMDIMVKFTPKYSLYAKRLLEYIAKNGHDKLSWESSGMMIYNGSIIRGTDMVSLVRYIFNKIGTAPKGMKQFRQGLNEIRTPKVYLKPFLLKPPGIPSNVKKNWMTY